MGGQTQRSASHSPKAKLSAYLGRDGSDPTNRPAFPDLEMVKSLEIQEASTQDISFLKVRNMRSDSEINLAAQVSYDPGELNFAWDG